MEMPANPDPWPEDAGDQEQTVQDFTPMDTGVRVVLVEQPQELPPQVGEDELLIAAFCEV